MDCFDLCFFQVSPINWYELKANYFIYLGFWGRNRRARMGDPPLQDIYFGSIAFLSLLYNKDGRLKKYRNA